MLAANTRNADAVVTLPRSGIPIHGAEKGRHPVVDVFHLYDCVQYPRRHRKP
jgi:hypothetical protein